LPLGSRCRQAAGGNDTSTVRRWPLPLCSGPDRSRLLWLRQL